MQVTRQFVCEVASFESVFCAQRGFSTWGAPCQQVATVLKQWVPMMPAWLCPWPCLGCSEGSPNTSALPHLLLAPASFPVKVGQDHSTQLSFQNWPPLWSPVLHLPGLPPLLQILLSHLMPLESHQHLLSGADLFSRCFPVPPLVTGAC